MADATLQILGLGTGAVPLDYNVTGDTSLDLIAVKADFDGSAAAVAYVAVVEIISPAGQVMAQGQSSSIAAGSSATVSFAPFLRDAAAAAAGITKITSTNGTVTVTNPNGPTTDLAVFKPSTYEFLSSNTMTVGNAASGSFTWSHANGSTLLDLTNTTAPLVKVAGVYAVTCATRVTTNFTAGGYAVTSLAMGDGGASTQTGNMFLPNAGPTTTETFAYTQVHYMNASARVSLSVYNNDGAAARDFLAQMYVVRIT